MTNPRWNRLTVVGCGLIGASFALAMKSAGACARVAGWDISQSVLDEALRLGVIEEIDRSFAGDGLSAADLVYLAMPVGEVIEFLRQKGVQVRPGAVITDAGSTKREVCNAAHEHLPQDRVFVGGHPIAGSHLGGIKNATPELLSGAPYVLMIAGNESEHRATAAVADTLTLLGARIHFMTPHAHDHAMALVSHLPQLVSSALAATVKSEPDATALIELSGSGYRDMTRLAASPWSIWGDILATNPAEVANSLDALLEKLLAVRDELRHHSAGAADGLTSAGSLFERSESSQR